MSEKGEVQMRRLLPAVAILAVLLVPAAGRGAPAATKTVTIKATAFSPTSVTIKSGDRITWKNSDSKTHQVVSDGGVFASPILGAGKSYSYTFNKTGTFRYHDGLYPSHKAKVVVQARPVPTSVTLAASSDTITYGAVLRLSGAVSTGKANETVTVFARRLGEVSPVQVATVLTVAGGSWSYNAAPDMLTAYSVRFRDVLSGEVNVQVRPRVRLLGGSRTHFLARVIASQGFGNKWIVLQRRNARGDWVGVRRLQLGRHSGRLFRIPRRHGTTVYRVYLPTKQAAPAYVAAWSGTQKVRRR
jgi:plastocyanin